MEVFEIMSEGCSGSCGTCGSCGSCESKLQKKMERIDRKILVLSGKGGVGKSTVAAALAVTLARTGKKVGLLDVDFHGPSQPTLFSAQHLRLQTDGESLLPLECAGVKLVSIGLLLDDENQAIVWRGPAKMGVQKQLLEETDWGDIDVLIMDFPPGTGDEALSACQLIGGGKTAVVVTTPQELSLSDCRKCLDFCRQLDVPVAGVVENMSGFVCPDCHHRHDLFSAGGGAEMARRYGLPLLGTLPLDPVFMQACDRGELAQGLAASPVGAEMEKIAASVLTAKVS